MIWSRKSYHICVLNRNVGDNAVNLSIREMLDPKFKLVHMELLGNSFDPGTIRKLRSAKRIVFGGGGLIHSYNPRGEPSLRTGTLWNIRLEDLQSLRAPIVLYGVGFNHFYHEPSPIDSMRDFFQLLISKQAIISMRNDGSKQRLCSHFPEVESHVTQIPDPGIFFRPPPIRFETPHIVLQLAADRLSLRYGDSLGRFLALIQSLCRQVNRKIILVPHTIDDHNWYANLAADLPSNVVVYPLKKNCSDTAEIIGLYAGADFTISTRGHSQICSIGNSVPTFSIGTHPKVVAFAQECGLESDLVQWPESSDEEILDRFSAFTRDLDMRRDRLQVINKRFDDQIKAFNARLA